MVVDGLVRPLSHRQIDRQTEEGNLPLAQCVHLVYQGRARGC